MEEINREKRIELIILSYMNQRDSLLNWIQKKEISIWSATLLYIGIYWAIFVFLYDKNILSNSYYKIITIIFLFIILLLFLAFIYSQFCAWIWANAARITINNGIAKLLDNSKDIQDSDFDFYSDQEMIPRFLEEELEIQKGKLDRFKDKKRPIKVLWYTIFGLLIFRFKYWRKNLHKNREKQEGIIYFILIILWIVFTIWVLKNELVYLMRLIPL